MNRDLWESVRPPMGDRTAPEDVQAHGIDRAAAGSAPGRMGRPKGLSDPRGSGSASRQVPLLGRGPAPASSGQAYTVAADRKSVV